MKNFKDLKYNLTWETLRIFFSLLATIGRQVPTLPFFSQNLSAKSEGEIMNRTLGNQV